MNTKALVQRVLDRIALGMTDATIRGEGYEALVLRDGIVTGRVYLGTVEEVEGGS
jgi:hypothetical protein